MLHWLENQDFYYCYFSSVLLKYDNITNILKIFNKSPKTWPVHNNLVYPDSLVNKIYPPTKTKQAL